MLIIAQNAHFVKCIACILYITHQKHKIILCMMTIFALLILPFSNSNILYKMNDLQLSHQYSHTRVVCVDNILYIIFVLCVRKFFKNCTVAQPMLFLNEMNTNTSLFFTPFAWNCPSKNKKLPPRSLTTSRGPRQKKAPTLKDRSLKNYFLVTAV